MFRSVPASSSRLIKTPSSVSAVGVVGAVAPPRPRSLLSSCALLAIPAASSPPLLLHHTRGFSPRLPSQVQFKRFAHHDSHHQHSHKDSSSASRGGFTDEHKLRLWMIGSAAFFFPVFWYLSEPMILQSREALAEQQKFSVHDQSLSTAAADVSKPVEKVVEKKLTKLAPPPPRKQTSIPTVTYVLVGAGTSSYHAIAAIREENPDAEILLIGDEPYVPYSRPPLSKELWSSANSSEYYFKDWAGNERSLFYLPETSYLKVPDAEELLSVKGSSKVCWLQAKVDRLDVSKQWVILSDGQKN